MKVDLKSENTYPARIVLNSSPYCLQSYFRLFLFTFILVILSITALYSQEQTDSTTLKAPSEESIRIAPHLSTTFHYPIKHGGYIWKPYFTGGIHIDFPTYLPRMLVRFSIEGGEMDMDENGKTAIFNEVIENLNIAHMALSVSYDIPLIKGTFILRPRIGLSNTMINTGDFQFKKFFVILRESENEFGIIGGIEPIYRINRIQLSLPLYGDLMFSSPEPFISGNVSFTVGVIF